MPLGGLIIGLAYAGAKYVYDKALKSEWLQTMSFAARTAAAALLARSDRLNRFVNHITFGIVNKTSMSLRLWNESRDILRDLPLKPHAITTRKTHFLRLLSSILKDEKKAIEENLHKFTRDNTAYFYESNLTGNFSSNASAAIMNELMGASQDPDISERWIANFATRHGWKPLEDMLKQAVPPRFGRDYMLRQLGILIQPIIRQHAEIEPTKKPYYDALSDLAHIELTGKRPPNALDSVKALAPLSARIASATVCTTRTITNLFNQAYSLIARLGRIQDGQIRLDALRAASLTPQTH
jgi:hypothetical protein